MSASRAGRLGVQGEGWGAYRHPFRFAVGLEGALSFCEWGVVEVDSR